MGGTIIYDHKLSQFNGITKNELKFRFVKTTSKGLITAHFGSLAATAATAKYGATVGGWVGFAVGVGIGFYMDQTYFRAIKYFDNFMTRFGGYIQRQAVYNMYRGF
ncbi:hypothetical protein HX13_18770 [Chryseobacterium sp. P1-3]|nr:hypothetical protein [Chryseobacterium sp. P1-3]KFF73516.1 hypothetical protein HX13_18770 [Chryseobacterium sp. P1-3]